MIFHIYDELWLNCAVLMICDVSGGGRTWWYLGMYPTSDLYHFVSQVEVYKDISGCVIAPVCEVGVIVTVSSDYGLRGQHCYL